MWLWEWITQQVPRVGALRSREREVPLAELAQRSAFAGQLERLRDRSVLLALGDQFAAALALIELDGVARRLVLCPPDLDEAHLSGIVADGEVDACVRSAGQEGLGALAWPLRVDVQRELAALGASRRRSHATEWVLLTSGTSGPPKLVRHSLAGLVSAFLADGPAAPDTLWSTFYDIRRYGGLQILLRALHGARLVLGSPSQSLDDFLCLARDCAVTHLTGTASHWRRVLMSGMAAQIAPRYVRLSGEIADQGVLDALRGTYPQALVAHAFASTEAGVAFEVEDGQAGFPAAWVAAGQSGPSRGLSGATGAAGKLFAQLRVEQGTLRMRSPGTATGYLGEGGPPLRDAEGFVDNGDRVELRAGRYYFVGRNNGIINVGGLKVHPEEVEAVINAHRWVRMSRVKARRSPITGAVVAAEIVLAEPEAGEQRPAEAAILGEIGAACRALLPAHKVPALISVVDTLPVSAAGKLVRPRA